MKFANALLLVMPIVLMAAQCAGQGNVSKIEFTSLTRGYQKQLFLDRDSLTVIVDGRQEANKVVKQAVSKGTWEKIDRELKNVALDKVNDYQSPSNRRAFDGAKHSTLKLITKDGKEFSHSFDDFDPHPALKPLLELVLKTEKGDQR